MDKGATGLTLRGPSERAVRSARSRVELLLDSAVSLPGLPYNYFISVPLTFPSARAALEAFRSRVLGDEVAASAAGLEASVFVDAAQLHLTVVMLKLYTEEKRQRVREILDSLELPVRPPRAPSPQLRHRYGGWWIAQACRLGRHPCHATLLRGASALEGSRQERC